MGTSSWTSPPPTVPGTVINFVTLARFGYYDDTTIFRAYTSIGILQGGGLSTTADPGYEIPDEGTGFAYRPGQLAMARTAAPNSAGGQLFFTVTDAAVALARPWHVRRVRRDHRGSRRRRGDAGTGAGRGDTPTETITLERVEITES